MKYPDLFPRRYPLIVAAVLAAAAVAVLFSTPTRAQTIIQLPGFISTSSPDVAVTQRVANTSVKITGLTTGLCLTLNSSNILTTTACGGGNTLGTTTPWTISGLAYLRSDGTLSTAGTTTPTCGTALTCTNLTTLTNALGATSLTIATSSLYTGTTGQLPYFSGTNTLTATSSIFLSAVGNIGVGTSSPWALLSVNPDGAVIGNAPAFAIGSSTLTEFYINNAGAAFVGSTTKLVAGSGWLATTPGNLQVANNLGVLGFVEADNGYNVGGTSVISSASNLVNLGGVIRAASTKGLAFQTNAANITYLTITPGGYIGIGTTTPLLEFEVASNTPQIGITNPGAGLNLHHWGIFGDGLGSLNFGTSSDVGATSTPYALTITNAGNVGIGTNTPTALLSINPNGISGAAFAIGSSTKTLFQVGNGGNITVVDSSSISAPSILFGTSNLALDRTTGQNLGIGSAAGSTFVSIGANGGIFGSGLPIGWSASATNVSATADTAFSRLSAGVIAVGTGAANSTAGTLIANTIGIGTSSPLAMLDVAGANNATTPLFQLSSVASFATTTQLIVTNAGKVGIGTTSPSAPLSINANALTTPAFTIGSTTSTLFSVTQGGQPTTCITQYGTNGKATSTAMTIDWLQTCPKINIQIGTAATTITFINATSTQAAGSGKVVEIANPGSTAGALTFTDIHWIGTAPAQTTTANSGDVYSFFPGIGTSTAANTYILQGAANTGTN